MGGTTGVTDGAVAAGVVHESPAGKLAEHASGFWNRAKAGYEKGKAEHEHGPYHEFDVDGVEIEADGVQLKNVKVGAWERLSSFPSTVAGVVGYRTTGTAHSSAGALAVATEPVVAIPKPRPIPDLVHDATEEVSGLVRAEMALIKTEVKQKVKIIAPALALFGIALTLLVFALPFLLWAGVFALSMLMPLWGAALVMFGLMLVIALILAFLAYKKIKKLGNVKSLAGGSIKEDIQAIAKAFKTHHWADAQAALKEVRL
jgi:hypothetical protein